MKRPISLFLLLVLGLFLAAGPALAAAPAGAPPKPQPGMFYSEQQIAELEAMDMTQRRAFFDKRIAQFNEMGPKDVRQFLAEQRKTFLALPPEKQKELNARMSKVFDDYTNAVADLAKKNAEQAKALDDKNAQQFIAAMPGYGRAVLAKYKELRKTHSKAYAWHMILEDAVKGAKLDPIPEDQ